MPIATISYQESPPTPPAPHEPLRPQWAGSDQPLKTARKQPPGNRRHPRVEKGWFMSAQGTLGARIIEKRKRGGDSRVVTVIGVGGVGVRVCAGWLAVPCLLPAWSLAGWQAGSRARLAPRPRVLGNRIAWQPGPGREPGSLLPGGVLAGAPPGPLCLNSIQQVPGSLALEPGGNLKAPGHLSRLGLATQ